MTQKEAVLEWLDQHGSITSNDAWFNLGITRLADVIYKLRKDGINVKTYTENVDSRYGKTEIAVYRMER